MKLHSPDLTQENIAKLAEMFPNCVTESKNEDGISDQVKYGVVDSYGKLMELVQ